MRTITLERYSRSIEECQTRDGLREILRVIASSGFTEQEFSKLFSQISARKIVLARKG